MSDDFDGPAFCCNAVGVGAPTAGMSKRLLAKLMLAQGVTAGLLAAGRRDVLDEMLLKDTFAPLIERLAGTVLAAEGRR